MLIVRPKVNNYENFTVNNVCKVTYSQGNSIVCKKFLSAIKSKMWTAFSQSIKHMDINSMTDIRNESMFHVAKENSKLYFVMAYIVSQHFY